MPRLAPVHYRTLARFFEERGFVLDRTEGDHLMYVKKGVRRPIVIPKYRNVPVFVVKNNLRSAGIHRAEYLKWLGR